jgi:hypothetical protein
MTTKDTIEDTLEEQISLWLDEARYWGTIQGASMGGLHMNGRQPHTMEEIEEALLSIFSKALNEARVDELTLVTEKFGGNAIELRAYKTNRIKQLTTKKDIEG